MGEWPTTGDWFSTLVSPEASDSDLSRPYPFYLAAPLDQEPETLGDINVWLVEWKWDGIRAQLVRRGGRVHLWSRGEELITARFPEIVAAASHLPDGTVLDGEVLAFREGRPLPFASLQQRIGRQKQVERLARDVPVVFMTYDILELNGRDLRKEPLAERRRQLDALLASSAGVIRPSPPLAASGWDELAGLRRESRSRNVEGLMLKRLESSYGVGRKRGDWWKWKIEPHTMDAVLIYAQPGSGKRASLLTDYTFGVWHEGSLVPIAKAYSGLSNSEIADLDHWIRQHTIDASGRCVTSSLCRSSSSDSKRSPRRPATSRESRCVFRECFDGGRTSRRVRRIRSGCSHRWFPVVRRSTEMIDPAWIDHLISNPPAEALESECRSDALASFPHHRDRWLQRRVERLIGDGS
jgi:DNA ligase-1